MSDISNITEILNDPLAPHSIYDDDDKSTYVSSTPGDKYFWKEKNNMKKYEHYMNKDRHDIEKEIYPADLMRATSRIQEFLKKNEESGKLKFEDRLLETIQTNHRQLQEDVKLTVEQFRKFVEGVEEQARLQQIEKMARDKKDWPEYRAKEKEYHETLKKGLEVMNKFAKAISMEPYAVDLKNHLWKYNEENIGDAYSNDRIKEMESVGYSLMLRFSKLLEKEGIAHSLPVPPTNYRARKFTKRIIKTAKDTNKKEKEPSEFKKVKEPDEGNLEFEKPLDEGVSESALTISSLSNEDKDGPVTPTSFLEAFASKRGLTLQFADISFKSTPFVKEYIVSCKLDTMGAEGKGRTKIIARETAASELIRLMLGKMKRSQMPPQIGSFTDQEKKLSLLLSCEFINYEKQLNNLVSGMNTTRTPQYAPIFNTPPGQFSFRCKALGYNAVGTGRTKEIAKRMGAKLLMDRIEDQREKYYVSKYGEKKARKFLKIR